MYMYVCFTNLSLTVTSPSCIYVLSRLYNNYVLMSTDPVTLTTIFPKEILKYNGEPFMIDCSATGRPTPVLTWYRDGAELSSSDGLTIINTTNGSYAQKILTISSVIEADEGIYKCIAINELPNGTVTQSSSFQLDVIKCKLLCMYILINLQMA